MDPIIQTRHKIIKDQFNKDQQRTAYEFDRFYEELERLSLIRFDTQEERFSPGFAILHQKLIDLNAKDKVGREVLKQMIQEASSLCEVVFLLGHHTGITITELFELFHRGYQLADTFLKRYSLYLKASNKHFGNSAIKHKLVSDLISTGTIEDWYWLQMCQAETLISCYDDYEFADTIKTQIVNLLETQFFTEITQKMNRDIEKISFIIQRKILSNWKVTVQDVHSIVYIDNEERHIALVLKQRPNNIIIYNKDLFDPAVVLLVNSIKKILGTFGVPNDCFFTVTDE